MKLYNKLIAGLLLTVISCANKTLSVEVPILTVNAASTFNEDDGDVEILVTLDHPAPVAASLVVASENYTAQSGEDYVGINNKVISFDQGQSEAVLIVSIINNNLYEEVEEFFINLSNPIGLELSQTVISITILDDDEKVDTELVIPATGYSTPEAYEGMDLIWRDEFDKAQVDEYNWVFEIGNGTNGWGNNELEYYRKENAYIHEGNLVIEAKAEPFGGYNYTSTRMITAGKFTFMYGRVDIRAALPYGQGIWPALWMLGNNISTVGWPACGEIDIMEMVGGPETDSKVHGTVHWSNAGQYASSGGHYTLPSGRFNDEFHVFSIEWDENSIIWYVDDIKYNEIDITPVELSEFRNNYFIIFNVAVGGNWPGSPNSSTIFPQRMIVDYIRVFQDK